MNRDPEAGFGSGRLPCYTRASVSFPAAPAVLQEVSEGKIMARVVTLNIDDKTIELPVIEGSEKELGFDITKLRGETGYITYDPALGNTGACKSAITFIDGDLGYLRYRGIPIEQLAQKSDFVEVAYLLIFGKLPTAAERKGFSQRLSSSAPLPESFKK